MTKISWIYWHICTYNRYDNMPTLTEMNICLCFLQWMEYTQSEMNVFVFVLITFRDYIGLESPASSNMVLWELAKLLITFKKNRHRRPSKTIATINNIWPLTKQCMHGSIDNHNLYHLLIIKKRLQN